MNHWLAPIYRKQHDDTTEGIEAGEHAERKVAWLELFYDLVFVATLIQLGNMLSDDVSIGGVVRFIALFIPIWWAWTGVMYYVNRFTIDDVPHRLLIFTQIGAIAVMAVSIPGAFEDPALLAAEGQSAVPAYVFTSTLAAEDPPAEAAVSSDRLVVQFTLAYVVARLVLVVLYARAYFAVPQMRPLTRGYIIGFSIGATIWLASAFVPAPLRYMLWALGIIIELGVPLTPYLVKWQYRFYPDAGHMQERFGIFTIIVLGESFVKVIDGTSGTGITMTALLIAVFMSVTACSIWWLYFDDIPDSKILPGRSATFVWIYTHLPLAIAITAFGVGAKKLLQADAEAAMPENYRWLITGAVVAYLVCTALLDEVTSRLDGGLPNSRRALLRFGAASLLLLVALGGQGFTPLAVIVPIGLLCVVQIAIGAWFDARRQTAAAAHAVPATSSD